MSELNIILAHKDFTFPFTNKNYQCFTQRDIQCNLPITKYGGFDDRIWGEFAVLYWLVSNNMVSSSDWVTLNHYRRILEGYYHHVSLAKPLVFPGSILQQTCFYHSVKYDEYFRHILTPNEYKLISNCHLFYPYNIFGVPGELLYQWVSYVGERLMKLKDLIHVETFEDACEFVKNDPTFTAPQDGKNTDIVYQARIYAFMSERLNTLFWLQYPGTIYHCEVKLLEPQQKI